MAPESGGDRQSWESLHGRESLGYAFLENSHVTISYKTRVRPEANGNEAEKVQISENNLEATKQVTREIIQCALFFDIFQYNF